MQFARIRPYVLATLSLALFVAVGTRWVYLNWARAEVDLDVYRAGGNAILNGVALYDGPMLSWGLLFTYPVFAAALFVPLALTEDTLARALQATASMASLGLIAVCAVRSATKLPRAWQWTIGLLAAVAFVPFEPIRETIRLGQINLILLAAILIDLTLIQSPRWRGLLIGLVTGIKLTPGVFILYLLVTRQWRAAANSTAVFAVTVIIGFAIQPQQAWNFWTKHIFDASRAGRVWFVSNQSITGEMSRLLHSEHPARVSTLVLGAIVVAVALWAAVHLYRHGEELLAVCGVGVASLLASPISWTHHWVWFVPCVIGLGALAWRLELQRKLVSSTVAVTAAVVGALCFYSATMWEIPNGLFPGTNPWGVLIELHYSGWEQLLAASYVLIGGAFLAGVALYALRLSEAIAPGGAPPEPAGVEPEPALSTADGSSS